MSVHLRPRSIPTMALVGLLALDWSAGIGCRSSILDDLPTDGGRDAAPDRALDLGPTADRPPGVDLPTTLTISPIAPTLTVETGTTTPTIHFQAKLGSSLVSAKWTLDQGEYGTLLPSGQFTPSGNLGGQVKVTATAGALTASTTVTIYLKMSQDGATSANGNPGPGGFGGVGGEGIGPAVSASVKALLAGTPQAPTGMKLLYPYDKTVWPLGILAPLLQWSAPPTGLGDGIMISLTSTYFKFTGYFAKPTLVASGSAFVRHPIPQDVWKAATRSAAGGTLSLSLTVSSGGSAYGPLTATWVVARGYLRGTVYYQSYGTNLAKNYSGALGGDGKFGGATLAIKGGSQSPTLVAGKTGTSADCRVCHSVAAGGSRMVVQLGNSYQSSSSYDLQNGFTESSYPSSTLGKLGWVGMTPDGKLGLGNAVPLPGAANTGSSGLYDMTTGAELAATGLSTFVTQAGFPMFSPSGKQVAFTFYAGPGDATIGAGDGNKLVVMGFDAATKVFSSPKLLYQGQSGSRPGWPAFWPTGSALLFQVELSGNTTNEYFATRYGGRGELRWVDLQSGQVATLDRLNGKDAGTLYIPTGSANHSDDSALNYEPTISPIASGGYAWVVFMSRRLYGNVATIDPWYSDPREHDLTTNVTTRKLWVAALELNPKAGSDPSRPAFYLPGQELMAGNSRGFWVADPCKQDGQPCEGGDECCGGYCTQSPTSGSLVCGQVKIGCSKEHDKCQQSVDCCDYPQFVCVNGYCARWKVE